MIMIWVKINFNNLMDNYLDKRCYVFAENYYSSFYIAKYLGWKTFVCVCWHID